MPRVPQLFTRTVYRHPVSRKIISKRAGELLGIKPDTYQERRTKTGKVTEVVSMDTASTVIKTAAVQMTDDPARTQGRIDDALYRTNLTTIREPKSFEYIIKGTDSRDKLHRFRGSMILHGRQTKNLSGLLIKVLIDKIRKYGYRTSYVLDRVPWSRVKAKRQDVERRKVLENVEIKVIVHR